MIRYIFCIAILISGLTTISTQVYGQKRSVVTKKTVNKGKALGFPDICRFPSVPSPPGVPIPYPNSTISERDQKSILSLFKGLDSKKYSIKFKDASTKKFTASGRYRYNHQILRKAGWSPSDVSTNDNLFVLVVYARSWKSFLGKDRVMKLNRILDKYR